MIVNYLQLKDIHQYLNEHPFLHKQKKQHKATHHIRISVLNNLPFSPLPRYTINHKHKGIQSSSIL